VLRATVFQDKQGEWRWNARDENNGQVMADSAEGYAGKQHALEAMSRVLGLPREDVKLVEQT
jgi:uncharacterized protein YegP (UPF0339 family)